MEGPSVAWMREQARTLGAAVTGSIQIRDSDVVFNRLIWATPDGAVQHYDKRHLFRMAREQEWYAAGAERLVVELRGWRICPLVCYDLRFPVFSRNRRDAERGEQQLEYDLLLYVANWPAPRHDAWRTLLRARAIENLCCVAGVNRAGTDGNGHPYRGGSAVIDAVGGYVLECDAAPQVVDATLSRAALLEHRQRFPAHLDADRFTLSD
jgi:omega-amidase